jgi:hypothetical protein
VLEGRIPGNFTPVAKSFSFYLSNPGYQEIVLQIMERLYREFSSEHDVFMSQASPLALKRKSFYLGLWKFSRRFSHFSRYRIISLGFLSVSLESNTVEIHESLVSIRACAGSESGLNSENGDRRATFSCAPFMGKRTQFKKYS